MNQTDVSLKPLLEGADQKWSRDHHVIQFHGGAGARSLPSGPFEYSVVLTERWRLVNSEEQGLFDMESDPSQRINVAEKHSDVVAKMRSLYEPFWQKVSPRLTVVRIDAGNSAQNPTVLCSQDWYMPKGNPPWNFNSISRLPRVTGPWMIQVKKAGAYRITLRQFPEEADKTLIAESARIEVAGQTMEQSVEAGIKEWSLKLICRPGPQNCSPTYMIQMEMQEVPISQKLKHFKNYEQKNQRNDEINFWSGINIAGTIH